MLISALGLVFSYAAATLLAKRADQQFSVDRFGNLTLFNHPFFQVLAMFFGEFLCLVVYYMLLLKNSRRQPAAKSQALIGISPKFSPLITLLPATCDFACSALGLTALSLTSASTVAVSAPTCSPCLF